jgi:choline transport protein
LSQTASRLTWAFARDNALFGSRFLSSLHPTLDVPVWALVLNSAVIFIIGCIYLGSSTAFNAFIGTGVILQQVTFAIPAALLLARKRSSQFLPGRRAFRMPGMIGWIANLVTIAFAVIVMIFYNFPIVMPVTSSNMSKYSLVYRKLERPLLCLFGAILTTNSWIRLYLGRDWCHGPRGRRQLVRLCQEELSWTETSRIYVRVGAQEQRKFTEI